MAARKITFFTSNLKMEELPYHGRLLARIDKMAMPVKFPEESVRRQMSRQENEEMMKFLMAE
jgi:DNA replication protein DnaC